MNNVSSTLPTETITFSHTSPTTKKTKREPSIPPTRTGATRTLTLQDSSTRNKKKRQSKSRDDDHSLLGKQSIESTTNDYVKDDWLVSDNDDNGNCSSSFSGSDWVIANKTEHDTRAKRKKIAVDRFSPDSSESVMDDYDSEEEYSDDSSVSSEDNSEDSEGDNVEIE